MCDKTSLSFHTVNDNGQKADSDRGRRPSLHSILSKTLLIWTFTSPISMFVVPSLGVYIFRFYFSLRSLPHRTIVNFSSLLNVPLVSLRLKSGTVWWFRLLVVLHLECQVLATKTAASGFSCVSLFYNVLFVSAYELCFGLHID